MAKNHTKLRVDTEIASGNIGYPLEPVSSEDCSFNTSPTFTADVTRRSSLSSMLPSPEQGPTVGDLQDIELQKICADEKQGNKVSAKADPCAAFACAWGFSGKIDDGGAIPDTKVDFIKAVQSEKNAAGFIQDSLRSYVAAIHSGEHHEFKKEFLEDQTTAAAVTIAQLDAIKQHLDEVIDEVKDPDCVSDTVHDGLKIAFSHARPWIQRTRQISVSNHVFYKINYVLCPNKDQKAFEENGK